MVEQVIYNSDLHFEHMQWKKELLFWKDEIKSFQNRLDEIVIRWSDDKILAQLGQFRHNFLSYSDKIDKLIKAIDSHEHNISDHFEANENCIDRVHLKLHDDFRGKLATFRTNYNELKHKLFKFLTEYM